MSSGVLKLIILLFIDRGKTINNFKYCVKNNRIYNKIIQKINNQIKKIKKNQNIILTQMRINLKKLI